MAYKKSADSPHISVSNVFIDEYMPGADGNFVKVYLTGLQMCETGNEMSTRQLANKLSMLESDVIRAWQYWQKCGAVNIIKTETGSDIEFLSLEKKAQAANVETKPAYTRDEVFSCMQSNSALRDMYKTVQSILGKPLSSTDIMVIYSFYDYYRLPAEVIPMLVTYAVSCDRKSMRSIEKIAQNWVDRGINCFEKATEYLQKAEKYNASVAKLKRAMGIYDRRLTETEEKYVRLWLNDFSMSVDLISYAYDITVTNTGKMSVKYMDKILQEWHLENIKTPAEANKLRLKYKQSRESEKEQKNVKKTGFNNFSQPAFNYEELEKTAYVKNIKTGE